MAAATVAGASLAQRSSARAGLVILIASGMMLATCVVDLLPEAWHQTVDAGLSAWVPAITASAGYGAMALFTRHGCGCGGGQAVRAAGAYMPDSGPELKDAAGVFSVGMGAAAALATHRLVEGSALALAFSLPVLLTLAVGSASDGLALASMLRASRQRLLPWLTVACVSPTVGMFVTAVRPLPDVVIPVVLALVAGVILRIAVVGVRLALAQRSREPLSHRHMAAAVLTVLTMGALLLAAH
ncbi:MULTISPECIES: ZIP family metal transporter [Streptomyces]|uniref:Permease n=2 Tax=Streptomyces antibioticus TaxID=1890 RepID=A0AAE6Y6B2_STRAT|nr:MULTISPECIES: hypothetical protein [Streptomyces]MCX5167398.1 hypothetical protein [Streptomyces antibioticus]QIT43044.1 hypothetical protein HCX60_05520 [Streptomyces antibioticus]